MSTNSIFRVVIATLVSFVVPSRPAWGTDPDETTPVVFEAADFAMETESETPETRYLLLENDRIAHGVIETGDQCYYLVRRGGRIKYDFKQVLHVADSLEGLHQFKSARIPRHDIGERMKLHRWCLQNHLEDAAMGELRQILEVDPTHSEAARVLRSMEDRRRATASKPQTSTVHRVARVNNPPPNEIIENFLRGHGKETFERFNGVERVLVNRCATGACHGSIRHPGEFRLYRPTEGRVKDQRMTAKNLQAILAAVDLRKPEESPILAYAVNAHGRAGVAPLGGINDPMYKQLRDWVFVVADGWANDTEFLARKRPSNSNRAISNDFASDRRSPAYQEQRTRHQRPELPGTTPDAGRSSRLPFAATADDAPEPPPLPVKRRVQDESRFDSVRTPRNDSPMATPQTGDPFDPAAFNQGAKPSATRPKTALPPAPSNDEVEEPTEEDDQAIPEALQSFAIPTGNTGNVFQAAPLPLSLQNRSAKKAKGTGSERAGIRK